MAVEVELRTQREQATTMFGDTLAPTVASYSAHLTLSLELELLKTRVNAAEAAAFISLTLRDIYHAYRKVRERSG